MFVVCFERNDKKPNEEYYYRKKADAQYHIDLFKDDNSKLYKKISLFQIEEKANQEAIKAGKGIIYY